VAGRTPPPTPSCCAGCTWPSPTPSSPRSSRSGATSPALRPRWPDTYVGEWRRSAEALGATDLPSTQDELAQALEAYAPVLEPVPDDLRAFLAGPPGLSPPEHLFYLGLAAGASRLLSPTLAPLARVPGRARRSPLDLAQLQLTRLQLRALQLALGSYSPSRKRPAPASAWRPPGLGALTGGHGPERPSPAASRNSGGR
jgi:hypothetical protein